MSGLVSLDRGQDLTLELQCAIRQLINYVIRLKARGGRGLRQTIATLHQSCYLNHLVCAVGGVLVFIAKSEWRGGEQKKLEKLEFDMRNTCRNRRLVRNAM